MYKPADRFKRFHQTRGAPPGLPKVPIIQQKSPSISIQSFGRQAPMHIPMYWMRWGQTARVRAVTRQSTISPRWTTCRRVVRPVNLRSTLRPPTIAEADWDNVPCNVCHRVKKGEVQPEFAWLSIPPIDEYEDLATTTDLCLKCHTVDDIAGHKPDYCRRCTCRVYLHTMSRCPYDRATCASEICHANVLNPINSHPRS